VSGAASARPTLVSIPSPQRQCQTCYMDENERGGTFYDRPGVLDSYLTHRHEDIASPNRVMEEPAFLKVLGDPGGKRIVDLGCGDGSFAEHLLAAGAESYIGIDASGGMISRAAQQVTDARATFRVGDIEDLAPGAFQVDLVTARMSLHYVADLSGLIARARTWLSPGGRLIFSVVHPVITSHDTPTQASGPPGSLTTTSSRVRDSETGAERPSLGTTERSSSTS
jgi:SAM-dependent methyltransferase